MLECDERHKIFWRDEDREFKNKLYERQVVVPVRCGEAKRFRLLCREDAGRPQGTVETLQWDSVEGRKKVDAIHRNVSNSISRSLDFAIKLRCRK